VADYLYSTEGVPQGFRIGQWIYRMDGRPVGRTFAEKAYRLDGSYVGAVINNMVVDRPGVSTRSIAPCEPPPAATTPPAAETRRPVGEAYPDCFERLLEPEDDAAADSPAAAPALF